MTEPLTRRQLRELEAAESRRGSRTRRNPAQRPASRSTAAVAQASTGRSRPSARPSARPGARASRPDTRSTRKRVTQRLLSTAALLFAGALLVGTSVPINAFLVQNPAGIPAAAAVAEAGQSVTFTTDSSAEPKVTRDEYSALSYAEVLAAKFNGADYTVNNSGAVRWPFPFAVRTTDGFGARVSPCRGCSTDHKGVDFVPGAGAPIYAIASGVVSVHEVSSWGYGNHVEIEHQIKGQKITSLYAHMAPGSSPLKVGDTIKVGDFVGLVGATGAVTAPHLHLEIHVNDVPVDPFAWLQANAK